METSSIRNGISPTTTSRYKSIAPFPWKESVINRFIHIKCISCNVIKLITPPPEHLKWIMDGVKPNNWNCNCCCRARRLIIKGVKGTRLLGWNFLTTTFEPFSGWVYEGKITTLFIFNNCHTIIIETTTKFVSIVEAAREVETEACGGWGRGSARLRSDKLLIRPNRDTVKSGQMELFAVSSMG